MSQKHAVTHVANWDLREAQMRDPELTTSQHQTTNGVAAHSLRSPGPNWPSIVFVTTA